MRIALTGVSGFIGSEVARRLHAQGHQVTGLVRATSRRDHIEPFVDRFVEGDHADAGAWPELLRDADCVIHNSVDWKPIADDNQPAHVASNVAAAINFLRASAPRRFVFISSVGVYHDMRPRWEGRIDEDHPLIPWSDYGAAKAAVEAFLWHEHFDRGRETCALRPTAVYGMDPRLDRTLGYRLLKAIRAGKTPNRKIAGRFLHGKFVHVDEVADTIVAASTTDRSSGQSYNLVDCYARWSDWATIACEELGVSAAEIDMSDPPQPKNQFVCDKAAADLGVTFTRGHEGIRAHLREVIRAIEAEG